MIGNSQVVIPAGSFHGSYGSMFQGMIGGSWVTAWISPIGGNSFLFSIKGGPIATPGSNPVPITLSIGGFTGNTTATWYF